MEGFTQNHFKKSKHGRRQKSSIQFSRFPPLLWNVLSTISIFNHRYGSTQLLTPQYTQHTCPIETWNSTDPEASHPALPDANIPPVLAVETIVEGVYSLPLPPRHGQMDRRPSGQYQGWMSWRWGGRSLKGNLRGEPRDEPGGSPRWRFCMKEKER